MSSDDHYALSMLRQRQATIERLEAELASWQRHGVKATEDCETCEGSGEKPCDASIHKLDKDGIESHPCPDCGGTGKKPRDGVERFIQCCDECHASEPRYVIPVEWLDAE